MLWSRTHKYLGLECCFNTQFLRSFCFIFGNAQFPQCRSLSGLRRDAKTLGLGWSPPPVGGCLLAAGPRATWMSSCSLLTISASEGHGHCSCCRRRGGSTGLCWETNVVWVDGVGGSLRIPPRDSSIYVLSPSSLPVGHIDTHLPWSVSCAHTYVARKITSLT